MPDAHCRKLAGGSGLLQFLQVPQPPTNACSLGLATSLVRNRLGLAAGLCSGEVLRRRASVSGCDSTAHISRFVAGNNNRSAEPGRQRGHNIPRGAGRGLGQGLPTHTRGPGERAAVIEI